MVSSQSIWLWVLPDMFLCWNYIFNLRTLIISLIWYNSGHSWLLLTHCWHNDVDSCWQLTSLAAISTLTEDWPEQWPVLTASVALLPATGVRHGQDTELQLRVIIVTNNITGVIIVVISDISETFGTIANCFCQHQFMSGNFSRGHRHLLHSLRQIELLPAVNLQNIF